MDLWISQEFIMEHLQLRENDPREVEKKRWFFPSLTEWLI
jgi:hypothetical protein